MSEWREDKLGPLADAAGGAIRTGPFGSQLHRHDYVQDGPVAVVMPKDMAEGRISTESIAHISNETASGLSEHVLQAGDIVLARRGDIGRAAWVDERDGRVLCGTGSMRIHLPEGDLSPRYLHYFLQTDRAINWLKGQAVGATMPNLNAEIVRALPVRFPSLKTQRRVTNVLDAIGDLIENNRRRIALLEQIAEVVYREWFVRFCYPGREVDELVDSPLGPMPAGWEATPFSDLGTFLNGFAFKPSHWHDSGFPIVKIKELKQGVTLSTPRYHGDDIAARYRVERGDLLFSWSAFLEAYLWACEPALLNQHVFKVTPSNGVAQSWLFLALRDRMGEFRSRSQGTTMKHIKRSALGEVCVITPTPAVMSAFDQRLRPILDQVLVLSAALSPLEALRDLLLPRLVTGAIDVSRLDLDGLLEESAA